MNSSHEQIDYPLEHGVSFEDTEMAREKKMVEVI